MRNRKLKMKKGYIVFIFTVVFAALSMSAEAQRNKDCFDFDWQFRLEPNEAWTDVQLPHDWSISLPFDSKISGSCAHLPGGLGWYKKSFTIPMSDKGRLISVLFDGIYNRSDVWVNGHHLGFRPYGFCYIEYDITPYIIYGGENEIKVSVNNPSDQEHIARWYTGSGINRHAWLVKTNKNHINSYGISIVPSVNGKVSISTSVACGKGKLKYIVKSPDGKIVAKGEKGFDESSEGSERLEVRDDVVQTELFVDNPQLWDIDTPRLYTLTAQLYAGGKKVDEINEKFGFRTAEFTVDKGFLLNGRQVKLKGFCLHQDDASLGSALPYRSMERKLQIFKDFGVNAIRCSHNQPAPEFLDLCDELGLLVIDEAFDKWKSGYYAEYFDEWWQADLENMLVRDRNHPSIILWSIGNELQEAWSGGNDGVERAKMLQDFVHKMEPTRQVCVACQNNHQDKFAGVTDVVGYNYQEARMVNDRKRFPDRRFVVTEELPYYQGAEGDIRAYDTNNPWNTIAEHDYIAGGFLWTGADYIGEAGWPSHGWPGGLLDICLVEKARAVFHKAMWNPDKPIVGIAVRDNALNMDHARDLWQWPRMASIWNFPRDYEGLMMEVNTITNCERVVLFINGKRMGDKKTADFKNHTIVWNVPFTPGNIEAFGINGNDTVAQYRINTAGNPVKLVCRADREELKADGQDLCYVQMELHDKDGNLVQHIDRNVVGKVEGEGRLIGLINSDLRRTTPFTNNEDKTYFGRVMAIVQTTRKAGSIKLHLDVEGLPSECVELISK